jgi:hypothetical protein
MGNRCKVPEQGGEVVSINVPNPAAATDWIYTVPVGWEMAPLLIWYRITCDANVANRYFMFVTYGTDNFDRSRIRFTNIGLNGQQYRFTLALGSSRSDSYYSARYYQDSLPDFRYGAGERWGSATSGIQAGDQYSTIQLLVARWRTN